MSDAYKFPHVLKVRMDKLHNEVEQVEFTCDVTLKVAPEEEVEPGGIVTDYLRSAKGCIEGAKAMIARALDEVTRIEAAKIPPGRIAPLPPNSDSKGEG